MLLTKPQKMRTIRQQAKIKYVLEWEIKCNIKLAVRLYDIKSTHTTGY